MINTAINNNGKYPCVQTEKKRFHQIMYGKDRVNGEH